MGLPTSTLTFQDLIVDVAIKLGVAYYGENGDEEAQLPVDIHDLAQCKRHVNDAIRMFLADAPVHGWRWARPVASIIVWPSVDTDDDVTITGTYDPTTKKTTITASEASFYPSMETKTIVVTDVDSYIVETYVSTTIVRVDGDKHWTGSKTFSIAADGNYTLPRTFGGSYTGQIAFAAGTNNAAIISWTSEQEIRLLRETSTTETGDPRLASVRIIETRRRWELMLYPIVSGIETLEFPFDLHFDSLVELDEYHPAGHVHDEAIKAACHAVIERDAEDMVGSLTEYYRKVALPNSYRADARSAPSQLGRIGTGRPTAAEMRRIVDRPTVTYTS